MDTPIDVKALREEFAQKKKELASLRSQLNVQNKEKEEAFRSLRSVRDRIKARSGQIKKWKEERDQLTKEVQELKGSRDKLNAVVKEKSTVKKAVDEKKEELLAKVDLKDNPAKIKAQIAQLEQKIETEVMPFTKEKELTKKIKELKALYAKISKISEVWKEVHAVNADFSESRKQAQVSHEAIQKKAHESQEKHQKVQEMYAAMHQLRDEEKPLAQKYVQLKTAFEETRKKVEELQHRVDELAKILHDNEEHKFQDRIKEKTAEVTEKIRKGKKLSTEDILAFQALKE